MWLASHGASEPLQVALNRRTPLFKARRRQVRRQPRQPSCDGRLIGPRAASSATSGTGPAAPRRAARAVAPRSGRSPGVRREHSRVHPPRRGDRPLIGGDGQARQQSFSETDDLLRSVVATARQGQPLPQRRPRRCRRCRREDQHLPRRAVPAARQAPRQAQGLVAIARTLLVIIWHLLADGAARYDDPGPDFCTTTINTDRQSRATASGSARRSAARPRQRSGTT